MKKYKNGSITLEQGDKFKFTYEYREPNRSYWIYNEIVQIKENIHGLETECYVIDREEDGTERERMWLYYKALSKTIKVGLENGHTVYLGNRIEDREQKFKKILDNLHI